MAGNIKGKHLGQWSDAMREMYLDLRSRNFSVKKARNLVLEAYNAESDTPHHKYTYAALQHFEREGGSERLSELEAAFREGAVKRSFSHKGSRVGSLIEVATSLLERFRMLDADPECPIPSLTALSREFRESLAAIQKEVDPLGLSDATVKSFYEQQTEMLAKLSDRGRDMLNLPKEMPWLSPPTNTQ